MTKVIFRTWKDGQVIALFPEIPADNQGYQCLSYMHVGQHGGANMGIVYDTKLSSNQEIEPLLKELIAIGYEDIKQYKKQTPQMREARIAAAISQ